VHFDCAGSHKTHGANWFALALRPLYVPNFRIQLLLWHVHVHFIFAGSHTMGSKALRGNTFCKLPDGSYDMSGKNFDRAGLQKTCRLVSRSWGATFFLQISSLIPVTCRPRKLAQSVGPTRRARHFLHQFPSRMLVVTCPCAFRLRGLAQNVRLTSRRHLLTRTCKWWCRDLNIQDLPKRNRAFFLQGPFAYHIADICAKVPFMSQHDLAEVLVIFLEILVSSSCRGPCAEVGQKCWWNPLTIHFANTLQKLWPIAFGDPCGTLSRSLQEGREEFCIICLPPSVLYLVCLQNHLASYHTSAFLALSCSNCKMFYLCFVHVSFPPSVRSYVLRTTSCSTLVSCVLLFVSHLSPTLSPSYCLSYTCRESCGMEQRCLWFMLFSMDMDQKLPTSGTSTTTNMHAYAAMDTE